MKLAEELNERYHIVFQCDEMSDLGLKKNSLTNIVVDLEHYEEGYYVSRVRTYLSFMLK
jgi:hypothetical protein